MCSVLLHCIAYIFVRNFLFHDLLLGKEHNFNTYDDTVSSALGVPYDYSSVMHYSKTSFNKGSEPTIVTKIPEFMDVIGQRMEFSSSDVLKLNTLYNCSEFSSWHHNSLFMILYHYITHFIFYLW